MGGAGDNFFDMRERVERGEAADLLDAAVREREAGDGIDAFCTEPRFQEEFDGIGVAAIDEEVVGVAGGVAIDGVAAVEWEDGEARGGALVEKLNGPDGKEQEERGKFSGAPFALEKPTGERGEED